MSSRSNQQPTTKFVSPPLLSPASLTPTTETAASSRPLPSSRGAKTTDTTSSSHPFPSSSVSTVPFSSQPSTPLPTTSTFHRPTTTSSNKPKIVVSSANSSSHHRASTTPLISSPQRPNSSSSVGGSITGTTSHRTSTFQHPTAVSSSSAHRTIPLNSHHPTVHRSTVAGASHMTVNISNPNGATSVSRAAATISGNSYHPTPSSHNPHITAKHGVVGVPLKSPTDSLTTPANSSGSATITSSKAMTSSSAKDNFISSSNRSATLPGRSLNNARAPLVSRPSVVGSITNSGGFASAASGRRQQAKSVTSQAGATTTTVTSRTAAVGSREGGRVGSSRGKTTKQTIEGDPKYNLNKVDGRYTREVQGDGVVVERSTKVLWDKKRTIAPEELTDSHKVVNIEVEETKLVHSRVVRVGEK